MIKDFIYYDELKIASYGSQLLEGIVDKITVSKGSHVEKDSKTQIDAGANAKITTEKITSPVLANMISSLLGGSAGVGVDLKKEYMKGTSTNTAIIESKIAEHHRFTLFRESLIENNLLNNLDSIKSHEWENRNVIKKLSPGDFIEMTSRVNIFDVSHLEGMAVSIEALFNLLQQFSMSQQVKEDPSKLNEILEKVDNNATEFGYQNYQQILGDGIAPLEFVALLDLMKNISSGGLAFVPTQLSARHMKASKDGFKFISPIKTEFLIDSKEEFIFKYGYEPDQNWTILAQICNIPKKGYITKGSLSNVKFDSEMKLDGMTETLTNMFMEMNATLGMNAVVRYPNISINLIAVYR